MLHTDEESELYFDNHHFIPFIHRASSISIKIANDGNLSDSRWPLQRLATALGQQQRASRSMVRRISTALLAVLALYTIFLLSKSRSIASNFERLRAQVHLQGQTCTPQLWSQGQWVLKEPGLNRTATVFEASGFEGCASDFVPDWNFGTGGLQMDQHRWKASQYRWQSHHPQCADSGDTVLQLLRSLVQKGGWFIVGDSISEQQFFSLSCMLYPHVTHTWDAAFPKTQHLHLSPTSSLLGELQVPASFSFDFPLITQTRSDHGYTQVELMDIYKRSWETHQYISKLPVEELFTDYPLVSPSPKDYLDYFTLPANNYGTLIFSTGPHFTKREFAFKSEPNGLPDIVTLYDAVVRDWVSQAAGYLAADKVKARKVVVRSTSSGHRDCDSYVGPLEEDIKEPTGLFNWDRLAEMNDLFEAAIKDSREPNIHFLRLDGPGRLRPEAHRVPGDCLHFAVGAGVYEGWNEYLAQYLPRLEALSGWQWSYLLR